LAIPIAEVHVNATSLLSSFLSVAPLSYLRIISAFFLTGFFPGILVYFVFFKDYDFNVVEKIGLVILISYCFSMISGLLLGLFQVFSTVSYVLAFWLFAIAMLGYRQIKLRRNKTDLPVKIASFSFDLNLIALAFAAIALAIFAYIQVLASAPMSGIVGGDVLDYMVSANRFMWSDVFGWSQYVWSNNFYLLISNLAGLPMHFVYVGLQFYLIIPIGAFYFLVRTIFPGYKKIAAMATMLCFFAAGVTSWLLFTSQLHLIPTIASSSDLFQYTGAPGITPFALSPWIFDFGFLFFALAFVYRGVFKKERKLVNYFLPAVFVVAAYFSHNFNIIFVFLFSLVFLGLFLSEGRMYVLKLSLLTLFLALALDPLSKWMLVTSIFAVAVKLNLQLSFVLSISLLVIGAIAIGITAHFSLSFVKKRNQRLEFRWSSNLVERTRTALSNNKSKLLFYFGGFTFFGVAIILYLLNYSNLSYISINTSLYSHFPWYMIVFRSYGIILPFALASIPFMVHRERSSLLFMSVVSIAIFISTAVTLSLSLLGIIPPYIGYVRYIGYLVIPLSILAAFGIFHSMQHLKKRHFKALFVVILVILVSTSILSQAYVREMFYDLGQNPAISAYTASAIDWMNVNLAKGVTILPLSVSAENILSNLVLDVKVTPNFQTWHLRDVLLNSRPEIVLYCLNTLGINYIVNASDSFDDSYFSSIVQSFPQVFNNETVVYKTSFSIFSDSNLVLVNSLNDDSSAVKLAFGYLTASQSNYSITDESSIDQMKPGFNYFLPDALPSLLKPIGILASVEQGSTVILQNSTYADQIFGKGKVEISFNDPSDVFSTNVSNLTYTNSNFSKAIVSFVSEKGSNMSFIAHAQIGKGSLILVNSGLSTIGANDNDILKSTGLLLQRYLSLNVPKEKWSVPYLDSLFRKITFSSFEQYTGLTPMNNKIIWFSNIDATGEIQVNSNSIRINEKELSVSSMSIKTNNASVYYEGKLLSDVGMIGVGKFLSGSKQPIILSKASGLNTYFDLSESQNVSLTLSGADIQFKIGSSNLSFNNANVSLTLKSSNSLIALCNQPKVTVNGFVNGSALGLIQGKTFDHNYLKVINATTGEFVLTTLITGIAGKFTIEFPYTDNLIYSQITNANELIINTK